MKRFAVPLLIVLAWQAASSAGLIARATMASPAEIIQLGGRLLLDGTLGTAIGHSLMRAGTGLALGASTGLALGIISGLFRTGEALVDTTVQMLRTLPFLAVAPLFIIWFGIYEQSKVLLIAFGTMFPLYIQTFAGIRGVDAKLIESARLVGLRGWGLVREVVFPGAMPSILVGLRIALSLSMLSLVVAEQLNARHGIGALVARAQEFALTDLAALCLVIYGLVGITVDLIIRALEWRLLRWRRAFKGA